MKNKKRKNVNVDASGNPIITEAKQKHLDKLNPPKTIKARTEGQQVYIDSIESHSIIFVTGKAGTGKTAISVGMAVDYLRNNKVKKIILSRPVMEACGSSIGFLPGLMEDKMKYLLSPLFGELEKFASKAEIEYWTKNKQLDIIPIGFMRGMNFDNAFVLIDESENLTFEEIKLILTRLNSESKCILSGDCTQTDLSRHKAGALEKFIEILGDLPFIGVVRLTEDDIVRSKFLSQIIKRIEEYEEKNKY